MPEICGRTVSKHSARGDLMFRRLLTEASRPPLTLFVDGAAVAAQAGDSVAAAMLAGGRLACRTTPISGSPRAPYCLMGACFDCLVIIDGIANRQACMTLACDGMRVETQRGKRDVSDAREFMPPPERGRSTAGAKRTAVGWGSSTDSIEETPTRLASQADLPLSGGSMLPPGRAAELREQYDVAVVGAGPAGLAAAGLCARMGLDCVLLDEQSHPGGQIYRSITASPLQTGTVLGDDYWRGEALARTTLTSGVQYVANATVWGLLGEGEIAVSVGGVARLIKCRRSILATGAMERPFPIPGWTLPGVMTAGGAQILLKSSAILPERRTVLAGCGPLIWLLAWQYLQAGVRVEAVLDTTPRANWARALPHAAAFAASPYFAKGLRLMRAVRREVRVIGGIVRLAAAGKEQLEAVAYRTIRGNEQRMPADLLILHQGVVPNVNLAMSANVKHRWSDAQLCWTPAIDDYGATDVPGLAIAGDGAGIAGAEAAQARGELAAIAAIRALKPDAPLGGEERAARALLHRFARGRAFLDLLHEPAAQFRSPDGETLVCRCEEVRAKEIAAAAALGCPGPNQLKAFLRCGMGPCQGRLCNLTVTELMAKAHDKPPAEIGTYRLRPPIKPITLAELASLPTSEAAIRAVARE
jgi:thioredoxin reductase/bacterioferritin-associated ferredoxin